MKGTWTRRILSVWLIALLLVPMFAVTARAEAPVYNVYNVDDVTEALSGHGRFSGENFALASIGLELKRESFTSARSKGLSENLYAIWSYISQFSYRYNGNTSPLEYFKENLSAAQFKLLGSYIFERAYEMNDPFSKELFQIFYEFLTNVRFEELYQIATPNELLGVSSNLQNENRTEDILVVYTSKDALASDPIQFKGQGGLVDQVAKTKISKGTSGIVDGVDAKIEVSFYKNVIRLKKGALAAGRSDIAIVMKNGAKCTQEITVKAQKVAETARTKSIAVNKVYSNASSTALGDPVTVSVTLKGADYAAADMSKYVLKLTNSNGSELYAIGTPGEVDASGRLMVKYGWTTAGKKSFRVYPGIVGTDGKIEWMSPKSAKVTIKRAANGVKITSAKPAVSKNSVDSDLELTIRANKLTTRVMVKDARGSVLAYANAPTSEAAKYNEFKLKYRPKKAGTAYVYVTPGNDYSWSTLRTRVKLSIIIPDRIVGDITFNPSPTKVKTAAFATVTFNRKPATVLVYNTKRRVVASVTPTPLSSATDAYTYSLEFPASLNAKRGTKSYYVRADFTDGWGAYRLFKYSVVN